MNSGSSSHTIPIFSIHRICEHCINPGASGEFSPVLFYNCGLFDSTITIRNMETKGYENFRDVNYFSSPIF